MGKGDRSDATSGDADLTARVASRIPLVLFVNNLETGENLYSNRSLAKQLGYGPNDGLDGASIAKFMHPEDAAKLAEVLAALLVAADGEVQDQVWRLKSKSGDYRWYRCQTQVFTRNQAGEAIEVLGYLEDITDRHLLEEQAGRTAKMEAVGQLAASIAHDFNNLLTAMSLNLSYLEEVTAGGQNGGREVQELQATVSKASVLTRHLLSFSQRAPQAPRPLEIGSMLSELIPFLGLLLGPRVTAIAVPVNPPVWVVAEPNQLEQVLINLASNAGDAMPSGGRFEISATTQDRVAIIRVQDSGAGIDKELRAKVFEPFFSTKAEGMGTGLGLASARRIVEILGGTIELVPSPSPGACFEIQLPAVDGLSQSRAPALSSAPGDPSQVRVPSRAAARVLLVEDEAVLRRLVRDLLDAEGYQVECAADPTTALQLAAANRPDLVLCDVVLPDINGVELSRRLRKLHPGLRVLYLTGAASRGALDGPYLAKPFVPAQLRAAVADQLSDRE